MLNLATPEIKFAIDAVQQASALVKQVQAEMVSSALVKNDRSPVTVADFAAQALVGQLLSENFPNDPLVGEEDSAILQTPAQKDTLEKITYFVDRFAEGVAPESVCRWIDRGAAESAPRFWTLDPIDGTKGFLRGNQYAVAFALIVAGKVQIGVLGCPNLKSLSPTGDDHGNGVLVAAARGQGAWVTFLGSEPAFQQLHVSKRTNPAQARLLRSFESAHTNVTNIDRLADALSIEAEPVRMDSQAKYAVLAAGKGEIYLRMLSPSRPNYREKIWDQAAGSLVTEEAGGRVTDLDGKPLDFTAGRTLANNRGVCASNGYLHASALAAIRAIKA
ncbi:MAG: 3'(2'),5'-bisphosphate nucleotidase [Chloroflexota bacterium]|nr:3'(2'),5'-bisphosphate nucleotidase [Chloroflexota bacterium]